MELIATPLVERLMEGKARIRGRRYACAGLQDGVNPVSIAPPGIWHYASTTSNEWVMFTAFSKE